MSADNGIYILETWKPERTGYNRATKRHWRKPGRPEFRIAHTQAIDCIFDSPDYGQSTEGGYAVNRERLSYVFASSPVFTSMAQALLAAHEMFVEAGGYVEYGIRPVNVLGNISPSMVFPSAPPTEPAARPPVPARYLHVAG